MGLGLVGGGWSFSSCSSFSSFSSFSLVRVVVVAVVMNGLGKRKEKKRKKKTIIYYELIYYYFTPSVLHQLQLFVNNREQNPPLPTTIYTYTLSV